MARCRFHLDTSDGLGVIIRLHNLGLSLTRFTDVASLTRWLIIVDIAASCEAHHELILVSADGPHSTLLVRQLSLKELHVRAHIRRSSLHTFPVLGMEGCSPGDHSLATKVLVTDLLLRNL